MIHDSGYWLEKLLFRLKEVCKALDKVLAWVLSFLAGGPRAGPQVGKA